MACSQAASVDQPTVSQKYASSHIAPSLFSQVCNRRVLLEDGGCNRLESIVRVLLGSLHGERLLVGRLGSCLSLES